MRVFSIADPRDFEQGNSTWSPIYSMVVGESGYLMYPYGPCGILSTSMKGQCCYSSLDTSDLGSMGYLSGVSYVVADDALAHTESWTDDQISRWAPTGVSGMTFCYLTQSVTPPSAANLNGYQSLFYIDDGSCIDGHYRCNSGSFEYYNDTGCTGLAASIQLHSSDAAFTDFPVLAAFTARTVTLAYGSLSIGWTAYDPDNFLVPTFHNYSEIVCLVLYAFALIGYLIALGWSVIRYSRKPSTHLLVLCCSQVLWVLWICFRLVYLYTVFPTYEALFLIQTPMNYLYNFSTLATTIYTTLFFNHVMMASRKTQGLLFVLLLVVHILLGGANYFWVSQDSPYWIQYVWWYFSPYWIIVMLVWDIIPLNM
ncbi:hypothetical protein HDU91_005485 [Kappamyces sp. JEL0680]|nr:hypothetical protein HDU91_005485 [Kappamyces sp. JEL0680]